MLPTAGNKHRFTLPAGPAALKTVKVGEGKRCTILVKNPGGETFDVVGFIYTEEEALDGGFTRIEGKLDTGLTVLDYTQSTISAFVELGIRTTGTTTTPIDVEIVGAVY